MTQHEQQRGQNEQVRLWVAALVAQSDLSSARSRAEDDGPLDRLWRDIMEPTPGVMVCPPESPVLARIFAD